MCLTRPNSILHFMPSRHALSFRKGNWAIIFSTLCTCKPTPRVSICRMVSSSLICGKKISYVINYCDDSRGKKERHEHKASVDNSLPRRRPTLLSTCPVASQMQRQQCGNQKLSRATNRPHAPLHGNEGSCAAHISPRSGRC